MGTITILRKGHAELPAIKLLLPRDGPKHRRLAGDATAGGQAGDATAGRFSTVGPKVATRAAGLFATFGAMTEDMENFLRELRI
jgi:hypothetical protein